MKGLKIRVARRLPGSHCDTREASVPAVPPLSEFEEIRQQLKENGLFGDETLVLIAHDGVRVVFDSEGRLVRSELFDAIKAPLALFTPGTHALTFATRGLPVYASNDDMAQMFGYALPCVDIPPKKGPAFLIRDRGFLVTGRFANELVAAAILAEKLCRIELLAPAIGAVHHLNPALCAAEHAVYRAAYSKRQMRDAHVPSGEAPASPEGSGASREDELRGTVIAYGRKLVEEHLIQATWGNVSVRVDDEHFLISPSGVDYFAVRPDEVALVSVIDGSYDKGLHPSSERRMHQLIYQERPDIRALVHTHSANCAVFAACHEDLLTEVLDYPCAPYAVSGSARLAANASHVMIGHDGCILANHGFVTGSDSLAHAFAQACEAEAAAGRRLGS